MTVRKPEEKSWEQGQLDCCQAVGLKKREKAELKMMHEEEQIVAGLLGSRRGKRVN